MKLWTPPSQRIIEPTCKRCGRLRREYVNAKRRSLGYCGLHRICCCGATCPATLDITFSNLDAANCVCADNPDIGAADGTNSISLDGTHQLSLYPADGGDPPPTICRYSATITNALNTIGTLGEQLPCATATSEDIDASIFLQIYSASSTIVYLWVRAADFYNSPVFWSGTFSEGAKAIGDTINNTTACQSYTGLQYFWDRAEGGSGVVSR